MSDPVATPHELASRGQIQFNELVGEFTRVYRRHWSGQVEEVISPGVPVDHVTDMTSTAAPEFARRWAVKETGWPRVGVMARNLPRLADPATHPLSRALSANVEIIQTVERLVYTIGERLLPWFGAIPETIDWVIVPEDPDIEWLGYWYSVIGWSLDEELDLAGFAYPRDTRIPNFWSETIAHSIKWKAAATLGLRVPRQYRPPSAIQGMPFARLQDPFAPLLDVWRCGVMLEGAFMSTSPKEAVVYVNARSIRAGTGAAP